MNHAQPGTRERAYWRDARELKSTFGRPVSRDDDDLASGPAGLTEAVDVCEVGQRA